VENLQEKAKKILGKLNLDQKRQEVRELEAEMAKPEFWQDREGATEKTKKLAALQGLIVKLEKLEDSIARSDSLQNDNEELINGLETQLYLSGKYDSSNALVSIHSGQGGVEAMDWAQMIYRMYTQFIKSKNWKLEEIDYEPGAEAGIKSVTFEVAGENVYGLLKHEDGVHRLVRQSPFNADHLRQTSFALVEVMPVIEGPASAESSGEVKDEDLIWDFFRSGGHGGQNVNKVSSAVRLTHRPTGIVVSSQKERDQSRNREIALKLLKAKLLSLEEDKAKEEAARLKGQHLTPGWGNQIRSYVLHPYHLVKDLRTDYEETDSDAVLNGRLDNFITAELHYYADGRN
jgi:peptide chain release factor 2